MVENIEANIQSVENRLPMQKAMGEDDSFWGWGHEDKD